MKSIGQVNYEARNNILNRYDELATPVRIWYDNGAMAVALHVLDMIAQAGISPADAAKGLREGRSLEDICDARNQPSKVRLNDLREGAIFETLDGVRAVKSEYRYGNGAPECVLLASGEYAHFSEKGDTLVTEIKL